MRELIPNLKGNNVYMDITVILCWTLIPFRKCILKFIYQRAQDFIAAILNIEKKLIFVNLKWNVCLSKHFCWIRDNLHTIRRDVYYNGERVTMYTALVVKRAELLRPSSGRTNPLPKPLSTAYDAISSLFICYARIMNN